jgi:hypothetical protein
MPKLQQFQVLLCCDLLYKVWGCMVYSNIILFHIIIL